MRDCNKRITADADGIERAVRALATDKLVAFPTETVYGLGANAASDSAVAAIFAVKRRPSFNPLIVHTASAENAFTLGESSEMVKKLAQHFWPGGLTLVMKKKHDANVSALATAGLETIALRVPAHPVAQELLSRFGGAIAAPSANPSGSLSPTLASHVIETLGDEKTIDCILDAGASGLGLESTVVTCLNNGNGAGAILLRSGSIPREDIEAVLGAPLKEVSDKDADIAKSSPGRLARHYAPRSALRLCAREVRAEELLLAFGEPLEGARICLNLSERGCLREAAANLFAHLAHLDKEAENINGDVTIAVMEIPECGLGVAINDRLRRGATR